MNRTPPPEVRTKLRQEVGFGCPAPLGTGLRCGNPYLYYHHFDPPWRVEQHHDPAGMIALCGEHHAKADAGAFTADQLRECKRASAGDNLAVRGRFDWMRERQLAVIGGNFYYETPVPLILQDIPVVAFNRDGDGRFMLNVQMPSARPNDPRIVIVDNDWIETGHPTDLESPPSGKFLRVRYPDGDTLQVEFREVVSEPALVATYSGTALEHHVHREPGCFEYPLLTVIITMRLGDAIALDAKSSRIFGSKITGSMMSHSPVGLMVQ